LLISKKHFWPRWLMSVPYHRNSKFACSPVDSLSQFVWMSSSRPPRPPTCHGPCPDVRAASLSHHCSHNGWMHVQAASPSSALRGFILERGCIHCPKPVDATTSKAFQEIDIGRDDGTTTSGSMLQMR
jgi:hypothetical protein